MGIDIHLAARTKQKRTEEELRELNYRFLEANRDFSYGEDPITLSDYNDEFYKDADTYYYAVNTLSRYYGEGYARGSFPEIYAVIEWVRVNFPEADVLYGGDHGYIEETPVFTKQEQEQLLAYWCKNGGLQYRGRIPEDPLFQRECPKHKRIMAQYMWSGGNGAVNCLACGYTEETKDLGQTWFQVEKKRN